MQQPVQRREGYTPEVQAIIGNRVAEISSVQIDRELPDFVSGGSLVAASGTVTAVEGTAGAQTVVTPWDPGASWPPAPETRTAITLDMGGGPVALLTGGRVTSASGGTDGRAVAIDVADAYRTLDRPISWDAFQSVMPPLEGTTVMRYVGLYSTAVTDMILRHCGWNVTPPRLARAGLSVPAMGTMWPERGFCQSSTRYAGDGYSPQWLSTPWGWTVHNVAASYLLAGGHSLSSQGYMEMTAIVGASGGKTMSLDATNSAGLVRLTWTDSTASVRITGSNGAVATVASLPATEGAFLYVTVRRASSDSLSVTLRVDGASATVTHSVPTGFTARVFTEGKISGEGAGAGFQIAFPPVPDGLVGWTPNAVIRKRSSTPNYLEILPPVAGENCADLLDRQCAAEAATYWIDETGVLQWWDLDRLESQASLADLTSEDDIGAGGFTWSHSLSAVKSRVAVDWREPLFTRSLTYSVDLWQGSGTTVQPGGSGGEEWIKTPDDEVWIMPDLALTRIGGSTDAVDAFNVGVGSFYGAVIPGAGATPDAWAQTVGEYIVGISRVTDDAFKMSTTWNGGTPVISRTTDTDTDSSLYKVRRSFDLPILRGKSKCTFLDATTAASQTGPSSAPDLVVECGWWIQNETQARAVADYYAARVTVPQPLLSSVELVMVPGLQLGDMVTVTDEHVTQLTIRGLVVSDSRAVSPNGGASHAVAIRPVTVTKGGARWEDWGRVMEARSWETWGSSQLGNTWEQWGSDPLPEGGTV